jgi:hypothetical protein
VSNAAILDKFNAPPPGWEIEAFRVDWNTPVSTPLDAKNYLSSTTCDALNRVKLVVYPEDVEGKRRRISPCYNRGGALESIALDGDKFIERIAYNAKGQRVLIAYGNGIMTRYAYDPKTFRLMHLRTEGFVKPIDLTYQHRGPALQEFGYDYDLVGNIWRIHDRAPESGIRGSILGPDGLDREFVYDALYRLRSAAGRECDRPHDVPWDGAPRCTDFNATRNRGAIPNDICMML